MRRARLLLIVQIPIIGAVSAVPGFAQSNTRAAASPAVDFAIVTALREYDADTAPAARMTELPRNVQVAAVYRPLLRTMLERSPTFRRQCARVAASRLLITIERSDVATPWTRARTHIVRGGDGTLTAAIQLVGREDFSELIGHEFEHIIEQLDGIDLPSRVDVPESGVSRGVAEANAFETVRAKRIGLMVAAEVRRSGN